MSVYLTSFTGVFSGDVKKSSENEKNNKKSSENYQSTGHFQSLFIFFSPPPHPRSEKKIP